MKFFFKKLLSIFLFLIISSTIADAVDINYNSSEYDNFNIDYLVDENSSMRFTNIINSKFKSINSKHGFNGKIGAVWYKLDLHNKTKLDKELYLHNNLAYYSKKITIYEVTDRRLQDQYLYDVLEDSESNKLTGSTLIHSINLKANSTLSLYIKNEAVSHSIVDFQIFDRESSMKAIINKSFYSNIIIAILLSLAAYNLMFYFFNKRKEFVYYALYLINASIGLIYMYGTVFNNFHLYGMDVHYLSVTMILVPFFLVFFLKSTFNLDKLNPTLNRFLNVIIYIVVFNIPFAFLVDLTYAIEIGKLTFIYSFFIIFYFSYYLYKIDHNMKNIFLLAYSSYIIGMFITILGISGFITLNFLTLHASGIGLVIESILFSYLINNHMRLLELEIVKQKEIIVSKNKKAQLGEMINAITHQWKQPISAISSVSTLLSFKLHNKQELKVGELEEKVSQINENILFLNETIDDFKDFFNPNIIAEKHNIADIINRAIAISQDDTLTQEIHINKNFNFTKDILVYKNELLHIILNIIQNSKEAFKNSNKDIHDIRIIKIIGYTLDDKTYIDIIDNAGGISKDTLPHIFNEYYTTKQQKSGSGLGLYLSKFILEENLKGSIEVKNIQGGAMFRIIL